MTENTSSVGCLEFLLCYATTNINVQRNFKLVIFSSQTMFDGGPLGYIVSSVMSLLQWVPGTLGRLREKQVFPWIQRQLVKHQQQLMSSHKISLLKGEVYHNTHDFNFTKPLCKALLLFQSSHTKYLWYHFTITFPIMIYSEVWNSWKHGHYISMYRSHGYQHGGYLWGQ